MEIGAILHREVVVETHLLKERGLPPSSFLFLLSLRSLFLSEKREDEFSFSESSEAADPSIGSIS